MPFTKTLTDDGLRFTREACTQVLAAIDALGGDLSVSALGNRACKFRIPGDVARKAIAERIERIDAELAERSAA